MSRDSSTVTLTMLASQRDAAEALFEYQSAEDSEGVDGQWVHIFYEVPIGEPPFLKALRAAGIAFDNSWSAGNEYSEGTISCRFTPQGECILKEIYDNCINPPMNHLLDLIDKPVQLRAFILNHKEEMSVLDLDENQVEYGKLFRMHQLIGSTPVHKED